MPSFPPTPAEPRRAPEAVFRSAPMTLVQFYVTLELARDVVFALGRSGHVHFRDLNALLTAFQRTFVAELRGLDALETKLEFVRDLMAKHAAARGGAHASVAPEGPLPLAAELQLIHDATHTVHAKLQHLDRSHAALELKRLALVENRHVLTAVQAFHQAALAPGVRTSTDERRRFLAAGDDEEALLALPADAPDALDAAPGLDDLAMESIAGTIARDKCLVLRKILWRTLRGNLYFNDFPIAEPLPVSLDRPLGRVAKNAFLIYIHGDYLKARVRKIIRSLDGHIYDNAGGSTGARTHALAELNLKINDLNSVVESTKTHLVSELVSFQEKHPEWHYIVRRERHIYEVLNKFDQDSTRRCLVGEGWIPTAEFESIRRCLKAVVRSKMCVPPQLPFEADNSISLSSDTLSAPADDGPPAGPENPFSDRAVFAVGSDDIDNATDDDEDTDFNFVAVVNELSTNRVPPTYHKTNKFTSGFQSIVDTYGIATYQEVNPGLATIVTFPFFFAIMFGDLGHGFIVMLVALYFIKNERYYNAIRNKDEILEMAFNGRYIVLLMGVFSMYTGLMYNDIFSKSMTLFLSGWEWNWPEGYDFSKEGAISLTASKIEGRTYPFGIDWVWHGAENGLLFTNSYKMKMSIVMGYFHMNYSLMFSLVNHRFFRSRVDIIGNFIPGFLFMQSIFGYLVLTIIYKWCVDWLGTGKQPPGLLNMLINMFLSPGSIEDPLYSGQKFVQVTLVLIALACVPWLLLYKPMVLRRENNKAMALGYRDIGSQRNHDLQMLEEEEALERFAERSTSFDDSDEVDMLSGTFTFPNDIEPMALSSGHGHGEEEFNLMDIVIHQVIHTIEFCLNCVSHTASYLRLWALSLAHAQLSSVLWNMTILNAFGTTGTVGIIMTVCLFAMWFVLTVCILVLMEGTSAMLHSLRLHWVEAMSKFFEGEGYAYDPFTFTDIDL
ncbi:V0/A0 complex, 116-kDa subunit of ATPase [Metschnikowia bicuspidata var. bicuspidata NRRL YB-4993]|uniref:V-type proton ATPase subunit a n=1 Tax=Metschnikowia bicuspidata var. bicuspidata NRRL YB-4993 TaxID=869754 RepID=A0A1A0H8L4_9ASCO|nr:V0/A0 complex, 116-kDa subunit of ATPase [Metschnikowia bicuspidata var. bicuspidata NRRL YB-4993]OBA20227.1 V0/A0 complex, 116-kDa subunit of ATPase [Metschnikowia bicuspidata var. bicuspidata NRRL YB-4993]